MHHPILIPMNYSRSGFVRRAGYSKLCQVFGMRPGNPLHFGSGQDARATVARASCPPPHSTTVPLRRFPARDGWPARPQRDFLTKYRHAVHGFATAVLICGFAAVAAAGDQVPPRDPPSVTLAARPAPWLSPAQVAAGQLSHIEWLDAEVIRKARQAVVMIQSDDGATGSWSGFFATGDGWVVTSASQLEGLRRVVIRTHDKQEIQGARVLALDPLTDLAVLATGRKKTAYLSIPDRAVAAGEPCAVIFHAGEGLLKTADGKLLARREALDWTESRFLEVWSVAVSPNMNGLTGAPVITRDGRVAGMCDLVNGAPPQKFVLALPEAAIAAVLERARAARQPLELPKPGAISGTGGLADAVGDPDYIEGMKLLSAGNMAAALGKYRAVLKRYPQNPLVMMKVAVCLMSTENPGEARTLLEEAIRLAPERLDLRLLLGEIRSVHGSLAQMIRYHQDLADRFPKLADAWAKLGKSLLLAGRKTEGLAAIRKWTELEPDSMLAWDAYAQTLTDAGDYDGSGRATERSSEIESLFFKLRYSAPKRD